MVRRAVVVTVVTVALVLAAVGVLGDSTLTSVLGLTGGIVPIALSWEGARRRGTVGGIAVVFLAFGATFTVIGDLSGWALRVGGDGVHIGAPDFLHFLGGVGLGLGLWRLVTTRDRSRNDVLAGWLDAYVVFTAAFFVVWQVALLEVVVDQSLPLLGRTLMVLSWGVDTLLMGLIVRAAAHRERADRGQLSVVLGALIWLSCDLAALVGAFAASTDAWLGWGRTAGALVLGAGMVLRREGPPDEPRPDTMRSRIGRLAVCLVALLVPVSLDTALREQGIVPLFGSVVAVTTVLLAAMMFVRIMLLVRGEAAARARVVSQQRYSAALAKHSSDAVVVVSRDGRLMSNPANLPAVFALQPDGAMLEIPGTDRDAAKQLFFRALSAPGEVVDAELRVDGDEWISLRVVDLSRDPDVNGIVLHVTDITDRKRAEEAVAHQAYHDALTGLANRTLFGRRVEAALRHRPRGAGSPAVIFIDLDGFKAVNDTLGHPAGDALLREVATRLGSVVRKDDMVARFGGDEFAVLVQQSRRGSDEAVATAQRVLSVLSVPIMLDGQRVTVSGSLGIAVGEPGATRDSLIGDADIAMYAAKAAGRNRWIAFDPSMRASAVEARELEQQLQGALASGEFRMVYQPVVDLADERVIGFEALLRWDSPTLGTVAPDRFVPVAEASGLIDEIGAWVLREACSTAADWRRQHGVDFTMAINVSAVQLASPNLLGHITEALVVSGLPAAGLVVEVTETALVCDPVGAREVLSAIRRLGVRLALDDFGTGYSSLAHLQQFTVDILKIDRSFVASIGEDGVMPPIVRGMIELGRTLGLEVVAEGVESDSQRRLLVDGHCDLAQGYLFARPLEAADAELLLLSTVARARRAIDR